MDVSLRGTDETTPNSRVTVRRGLTIEVVDGQWVWAETGECLLSDPPIIRGVYVDESRRVRYRGYVQVHNNVLTFDSVRFRKDACSVIEAVLVRAGLPPPVIHPMVVPHVAAVALYLYRD
jgi:hypothetical protein